MNRHVVSVYDQDAALVAAVADFAGPALAAGSPVLIVATPEHVRDVNRSLAEAGIDLAEVVNSELLKTIDAAELLEAFLVDGLPDAALFDAAVGTLVRDHGVRGEGALRAFGEMVALLWDKGSVAAALQLEALWNGLLAGAPFSLLCGYPQRLLDAGGEALVCAHHDELVRSVAPQPGPPGRVARRFERTPSGAHAARAFLTGTLLAWDRAPMLDAAQVVVSELAGNALRHGAGRFSVAVELRAQEVWIGVHDSSPRLPQRREAGPAATGGRGLELIEALSVSWGTTPEPEGKTVWAVVRSE